MNTKSSLGFGLMVVIVTASVTLSIGATMMAYAQEITTEQAYTQENVTGTQNSTGVASNGEADDKSGVEDEGPGEDDDEPGDIDANDKED
jgi:hypothetical protein